MLHGYTKVVNTNIKPIVIRNLKVELKSRFMSIIICITGSVVISLAYTSQFCACMYACISHTLFFSLTETFNTRTNIKIKSIKGLCDKT